MVPLLSIITHPKTGPALPPATNSARAGAQCARGLRTRPDCRSDAHSNQESEGTSVGDNDRDSGPDTGVGPPDPALIRSLVDYEYRSMVIRQLQVTVEWQQTEWLDLAA